MPLSLWTLVLLIGIVSANRIDDSCKAPKGYTKDGKLAKIYDNIFEDVTEALNEVFSIQEKASTLIEQFEDNKLNWFDNHRTKKTYFAFQGDQWREENPDAAEKDRPADGVITKQKHWNDFKSTTYPQSLSRLVCSGCEVNFLR